MKQVKRQRGYTRVSPKNQVTIPAGALTEAGLRPGDRLRVTARRTGEIVLERERDPIEEYAGMLSDSYPPGYLDELRGEWR